MYIILNVSQKTYVLNNMLNNNCFENSLIKLATKIDVAVLNV